MNIYFYDQTASIGRTSNHPSSVTCIDLKLIYKANCTDTKNQCLVFIVCPFLEAKQISRAALLI